MHSIHSLDRSSFLLPLTRCTLCKNPLSPSPSPGSLRAPCTATASHRNLSIRPFGLSVLFLCSRCFLLLGSILSQNALGPVLRRLPAVTGSCVREYQRMPVLAGILGPRFRCTAAVQFHFPLEAPFTAQETSSPCIRMPLPAFFAHLRPAAIVYSTCYPLVLLPSSFTLVLRRDFRRPYVTSTSRLSTLCQGV